VQIRHGMRSDIRGGHEENRAPAANPLTMKRLVLASMLLLATAVPSGAHAAVTRCQGLAPMESGCSFTVIATTPHVSQLLTSNLFTGIAEYEVTGPSGRFAGSCYAHPGVVTCIPSERGWFDPGDEIRVSVSVTGAGDWEFSLWH